MPRTRNSVVSVATFNINNINKRLQNLLAWLKKAKPDIVCLQELKCLDAQFPVDALNHAGYGAAFVGQKSWNGVAILAKDADPIVTLRALPGDTEDMQSRYIEAAVAGLLIASIYLPNDNPRPGPKFDYKLAWYKRLHAHAAERMAAGVPMVFAGDFNVAPTDLDIYPTRSWDGDALVHPSSRRAFQSIIDQGWTDALRHLDPDGRPYTFWSYWRNRYPRDAGLRLDHLLLTPDLEKRLVSAGVDRDIRGLENASDHAPAWIKLSS